MRREGGFTLIELLVVILIVAILAAVAVPVFLRQREKGYQDQVQSALKNAATAIESYSTRRESLGDLSALDGGDSDLNNAPYQLMLEEGYRASTGVGITVAAPGTSYCVTATHADLPASNVWQIATYNSDAGAPAPADADTC